MGVKCSTNHEKIEPDNFVVKMGGLLCPECRTVLHNSGTPMYHTVRKYLKQRIRPVGDITLDLEALLIELTTGHKLQWGEVLGLIHSWLQIHAPESREEYTAGGNPVFQYGPLNK